MAFQSIAIGKVARPGLAKAGCAQNQPLTGEVIGPAFPVFRSTDPSASLRAILVVALAAMSWTLPMSAQERATRATAGVELVIVTGTRPVADEEVTKRVEAALDANPYLDASRITVTTVDGVVLLEGLVGDAGDLFAALRTARRVAGARRVVDNLDTYEPDGFGM